MDVKKSYIAKVELEGETRPLSLIVVKGLMQVRNCPRMGIQQRANSPEEAPVWRALDGAMVPQMLLFLLLLARD